MTWDPELAELAHRKQLAAQLGGAERVERQHATGRLTVRERLDALLDAGSWREVGSVAGTASYDEDGRLTELQPASIVAGTLDGRRVVVTGDDFTIKGGAANVTLTQEQVDVERRALAERVPVVRLLDGTGGGGSVQSLEEFGRTYVPYNPGWDAMVALMSSVPVVTAALGPVAGLGAVRLVTSHVSVMVRELAQVFVAGPAVVEAGMGEALDKEQLGGWRVAARAGTVDLVVDSEHEAFAAVKQVLSYLPPNVWTLPPVVASDDPADRRDEALRSLVPRERRRPYDVRALLSSVFDEESVLELGRLHASGTVTALARLGGRPVAVLAQRPVHLRRRDDRPRRRQAGPLRRPRRHVRPPGVHLVDQPGFVIGSASEAAAVVRHGARTLSAVLAESPDAQANKDEIAARLEAVRSPFRTAESYLVEEVVDPAETRPLLCEWAAAAYDVLATLPPGPPTRGMRP